MLLFMLLVLKIVSGMANSVDPDQTAPKGAGSAVFTFAILSEKFGVPNCKTLRKHAYSNILKISPPKTESFQIKNSDIFYYFCSKHRLWVLVRTASVRRF